MVYVFLADGFEEIEALTSVDLLRRAKIEVITVGVGKKEILGSNKIRVIADICENEINSFAGMEMMILPGGLLGVENLSKSSKVKEALDYAAKNEKYISAICAAPTLLAKLGYLKGTHATCYPDMSDEMADSIYVDERLVIDGQFITSRGAGSSEEFALANIGALRGYEAAQDVKQKIHARD